MQVRLDVADRLDDEDPALPARVGRLQHRGEADLLGRAIALREDPKRREPRLGNAVLGEPPPHRHLVRHQVRRLGADPRKPARLRDRRDDRHRPVGRHRQHAVELDVGDRRQHRLDIGEVDDEANVGLGEPERVPVPVHREHAQPELLRPQDRVSLVTARADEEDRSSSRDLSRASRATIA